MLNTSAWVAAERGAETASGVALNRTARSDDSAKRVAYSSRAWATPRSGAQRAGQVQDGLTDIGEDRSSGRSEFGELHAGFGDAAVFEHLRHGLRLGVDVAEYLGETVVHVPGDPLTLALDGQLLQLVLKAGGLDRQTHLSREGGQRFHLGGLEARRRLRGQGQRPDPPVAVLDRGGGDDLEPGLEEAIELVVVGRRLAGPGPLDHTLRRVYRTQPQKAVGRVEGHESGVHAQQPARVLDDDLDRVLGIGLAGDRHADVVHGSKGRISRLQRGVPLEQIPAESVDAAERQPGRSADDRRNDHGDEQGAPGALDGGVEGRVDQGLDDADECYGGDNGQPAMAEHADLRGGIESQADT